MVIPRENISHFCVEKLRTNKKIWVTNEVNYPFTRQSQNNNGKIRQTLVRSQCFHEKIFKHMYQKYHSFTSPTVVSSITSQKSPNLNNPSFKNIFSGLMSKCTLPCWWINFKARNISLNNLYCLCVSLLKAPLSISSYNVDIHKSVTMCSQ